MTAKSPQSILSNLITTHFDFLGGFRAALSNTKRLISSADAIATTGEHGPANSLLILAIEECVKAGFLLACELLGELPIKTQELLRIFRHHQHKHYLGFATLLMINTANTITIKDSFIAQIKHRFQGVDESDTQLILQLLEDVIGELVAQAMEATNSAIMLNKQVGDREWWVQANTFRNRGFYTDYDSGRWVTPQRISKDDFEKTKEIVTTLLAGIEEYKDRSPESLSVLRRILSAVHAKHRDRELNLPDVL